MRLTLGRPYPGQDPLAWMQDAVAEIERASAEDPFDVIDGFSATNFTPTRALDASAATLPILANFIATLIDDLQKRGQNRVE